MATIPRTYLTTNKSNLNNIPLLNGQVISIYDADEVWYDAPINGSPEGNPVRRKISDVRIINTLIEDPEEGKAYIYMPEDPLDWDLRVWVGGEWCVIADITEDTKEVKTEVITTDKFYLTGTTDPNDDAIGFLQKNISIYAQNGVIHADLAGNADTATNATSADTADVATTATNDALNQSITGYLREVSSDAVDNLGSTLTFTDGDGTVSTVRVSDHVYNVFSDVYPGIVPDTSTTVLSDTTDLLLTGSGWMDVDNVAVGSATSATSASEDASGNTIDSTYFAGASFDSASGDLTLTAGDGSTATTVNIPCITVSNVFTQDTNGLVPAPGSGGSSLFLKGNGTWASVPVPNYQGATASTAGVEGLVIPATAGQMNYFFRGDGTWGTTFSVGNDGLVPAPTSNDTDKFLQAVSDGQGGVVGQWTASGGDTKNTAGATQVIPDVISTDDLYEGDGVTTQYTTSHTILEITTITIDDVATSSYTVDTVNNVVTFTTAPTNGAIIKITYQTYNFDEVLYVIGAKSQNANPQTFTDSTVYIKSNTLYSKGYEVVDLYSSQDLYNKTFGGQPLGTAAFKKADSSVTITEVTMTDSFSADGAQTDFTTSYSMLSLTNIVVSEVVSASSSFTGDGTTTAFGLTDTIITVTSVTIDGTATSAYIFDLTNNAVVFDTAPANGSAIVINYSKYQTIATPAYTVNTGTSTVSFTTAPDAGDKIDITYKANDPTYDSTNVPTNQAVITYTNGRINTVQDDLTRRVPTSMVAATYDSTATYAVGDYCIYDNGSTTDLYVCNTLIASSEPWTLAHWTKVILTDRLDLHNYSGTERVTGTWKDGKVLYEQTITISNISTGSTQTVSHGITFDKIFIAEGFTEYSISSDTYFGTISAYDTSADNEQFCVKIGESNISYNAGTNLSGGTAYLTVRYTKPST